MTNLTQAMQEYADAIRGDWSNLDGRSERNVIESWITEIESGVDTDIDTWRSRLGLCPDGGGHWGGRWGHCSSYGCPTYTKELAEDGSNP